MLTVGIELEFGDLEKTIEVVDAKYSGKPLEARRSWVLCTDGSCGDIPGEKGYEVNSPVIDGIWGLDFELEFIERWMVGMKATLNKRCGFHIHVGGFSEHGGELLAVVHFMCRYEKAFMALVEPERRANTYCAPLGDAVRKHVPLGKVSSFVEIYAQWDNRRYWLNTRSLSNHGTLELRLPEGTLSVERIRGWIHLYLACCEGVVAKHRKNPAKSIRSPQLSNTDDSAMLVHDMLTSAGTYGAMAKEKGGWGDASIARKFAAKRFKEIHGESYRTRVDKATRQRAKLKRIQASEIDQPTATLCS